MLIRRLNQAQQRLQIGLAIFRMMLCRNKQWGCGIIQLEMLLCVICRSQMMTPAPPSSPARDPALCTARLSGNVQLSEQELSIYMIIEE